LPVIAQFELYVENTENVDKEDYRFSVSKERIRSLDLNRKASVVPMHHDTNELSIPELSEEEIENPLALMKGISVPVNDDIDAKIEKQRQLKAVNLHFIII
jgi:hypothetical protein